MKKIYLSPEFEFSEVEIIDCLAMSNSVLPENPIPDVTVPGGGGDDFIFDW